MRDELLIEGPGLNRDPGERKLFAQMSKKLTEDELIDKIKNVDGLTKSLIYPKLQESLRTKENFNEMITVLGRLYNNSARNALAAWAQNEDALVVMGKKQWENLGCKVLEGALPHAVIIPKRGIYSRKGKPLMGYDVGFSYDIKDVDLSGGKGDFVKYVSGRAEKKFQAETPASLGPILLQMALEKDKSLNNKIDELKMRNNPNLTSEQLRYNFEAKKIEMNMALETNYLLEKSEGTLKMIECLANKSWDNRGEAMTEIFTNERELTTKCVAIAVANYFDLENEGVSEELYKLVPSDATNREMQLDFVNHISDLTREIIKKIEEIDVKNKARKKDF